mgnify:CR=1 FL=1
MTNKKEKLRLLLEKLNSLENKGSLPIEEIDSLTKDLITEEITKLSARLKDNSMVNTLNKFRQELLKFKTDFDLKPIIKQIQGLQDEIEQSEKEIIEEFETKIEKLKILIPKSIKPFNPSGLIENIENLRDEFNNRLTKLDNKDLEQNLKNIQKQFQDFVLNEIELGKLKKEENKKLSADLEESLQKILNKNFEEKIAELRASLSYRSYGGGNANRQINVSSSVMSTRYTDINFIPGSTLGITTANDDVYKRVNITISGIPSSIASAVVAGNNTEIQYNNSGTFGASSTLTWNRNTSVLSATNVQIPSFTQGSVPFQLSSSVLGQDNANLFWDDTSNFLRVPTIIGGTATTADLTLQTTSGIGTSGADMHFLVGNNGATEAMTILNNGNVGIGTTSPAQVLDVYGIARVSSNTPKLQFYDIDDNKIADLQNANGLFGVTLTGSGITPFTVDLNSAVTNTLYVKQGNVGIGTTGPTNLLSLGGNAARIFWMERHTTADTAGNSLTVQSGGATAAATDKAGGNLILAPGLSTGTGESGVIIQGSPAAGTGTADNAVATQFQVLGNKIGFFTVTPVVRQTELTDELTTITFSAPGTPDYAIQDLVQNTGFGFVTKDEGNTALSVIANLQARVNELETKLTAYGLLIDAD